MSTARHRPRPSVVPWAEVVPDAPYPMTIDDLLAWPDDGGYRYELVEGILVRVPGSGYAAALSTAAIGGALYAFVHPRRLGGVTSAKGLFTFPDAATALMPNVGYYVAARRALIVDRTRPIPFAPDLAVEVVPAPRRREALAAKVRRYLDGGTRLVWVVWPERQQVEVWHTGRSVGPAAVLTVDDALDGEGVLPGFSHPVAAVFADPLG